MVAILFVTKGERWMNTLASRDLKLLASILHNPYGLARGRDYAEERYRKHVWVLLESGTVTSEDLLCLDLSQFGCNGIEFLILTKAVQWARGHVSQKQGQSRRPTRGQLRPIKSILHNPYGPAKGRKYAMGKYLEHVGALRLSGTVTDEMLRSCDLTQFNQNSIEMTVLAGHQAPPRRASQQSIATKRSPNGRSSSTVRSLERLKWQLSWLSPRVYGEAPPFSEE